MQGDVVETEKKVWIQHFQVDKEAGNGKTDFLFKQRFTVPPSVNLRNWLRKDIIVELWETRPKVLEKKLEDETTQKELVLDADGTPVIDKRLRGVRILLFFWNSLLSIVADS